MHVIVHSNHLVKCEPVQSAWSRCSRSWCFFIWCSCLTIAVWCALYQAGLVFVTRADETFVFNRSVNVCLEWFGTTNSGILQEQDTFEYDSNLRVEYSDKTWWPKVKDDLSNLEEPSCVSHCTTLFQPVWMNSQTKLECAPELNIFQSFFIT